MKTIAFAALLLGGCTELYTGADCPGDRPGCPSSSDCDEGMCLDNDLYECDAETGEWQVAAICEGEWVYPHGDWRFTQGTTVAACDGLPPTRTLSVDEEDGITADAPIAIVEGDAHGSWLVAHLEATVDDDWGGVPTRVAYELEVSDGNDLSGTAEVEGGTCGTLRIDGKLCPSGAEACTVYDDGRHGAWCQAGRVHGSDESNQAYCMPGTDDEVCWISGARTVIATCPGSCADDTDTIRLFATTTDYEAFDPTSMCAP